MRIKTLRNMTLLVVLVMLNFGSAMAQASSKKKLSDDDRMAWWRDAKFGMFIHWGAYSIIGGERGSKIAGGGAEWAMDKLDYTIEDYEKYPKMFNPQLFDADAWVTMAKNAGMKYIVLTSKHHEGFALWDSKVSDYDVMDTSPFKRDIVKELAKACKKQGIKFCLYYSIVDWHHPQAQGNLYPNYNISQHDDPSVVNPEFPKYYEDYMKPQVGELLKNYGDIGVVWFDGDWISDYTTEMGKDLYKYIRDIQPNTIVNNRVDKGRTGMDGMNNNPGQFAGDFGTPEQEIPDTGIDSDWEACMTMNGTWGYKPDDNKWKSSEDLIEKLVDIVSKGGNFLLNIGPDGFGRFPAQSIRRLGALGQWTKKNGEAIYGASASPYEKPKWGRYTQKDGVVYAHVFNWPKDGLLKLNKDIKFKKVTLLTDPNTELNALGTSREVIVEVPMLAPDSPVSVVKIELAK
ncbi:alpha-L-fucosidase [Algibacter mikhailovii]|uniref:alpha-L-fucosidase n=1 Tax=Algibacter mikhailovii TaxID=425498 RepID=UPI002493EFFC|nr:alpha-L-fucosidase [Algibacter mikhailovii]